MKYLGPKSIEGEVRPWRKRDARGLKETKSKRRMSGNNNSNERYEQTHLTRSERAGYLLLFIYLAVTPVVPSLPIGAFPIAAVDILCPFGMVLTLLTFKTKGHSVWWGALLSLSLFVFASLGMIKDASLQYGCALRAFRFAEILLPFFLASNLPPSKRLIWTAVKVFFVSGLISIVVGFVLFVLQVQVRDQLQKEIYETGDYLFRAGGVFGDTSAYGHLLATWFCVSIFCGTLIAPKKYIPVLTCGLITVTLYGLYASASRSCLINIFAACGCAIMLRKPTEWFEAAQKAVPILIAGVAIALVIIVGGVVANTSGVIEFINSRFGGMVATALSDPNAASSGRVDAWMRCWEIFLKSPLIGVGYKTLYVGSELPPDNNFIAIAVEVGLAGLAALIVYYVCLFADLRHKHRRGSLIAWALIAIWAGQVAQSFTVDIWTFWGSMPSLLVITALLFKIDNRQNDGEYANITRDRRRAAGGWHNEHAGTHR